MSWKQFKARYLIGPDPQDAALNILAHRASVKRILPSTFRRPNGEWARGCTVFAQNDAARAELLYCVDCLPPAKVTS